MKQYDIKGMSCAACSARVEKAVMSVEGVDSCNVSLLTNSLAIEGSADDKSIITAVKKAGYGISVKKGQSSPSQEDDAQSSIKKSLIASVILVCILMYFSMGHMAGIPMPDFVHRYPAVNGIIQAVLSLAVLIINRRFFINGIKGVINKAPNMDTLVAMGSGVSFIWSCYTLFMIFTTQNTQAASELLHSLYFESAAMILTLITVGKLLEARSKGKTTSALKSLMKLRPEKATVIRDGKEVSVKITEVNKGDVFVVRPGESVPVDGIVLEGFGSVDESALTGESIPVDKNPSDKVSAATINRSGFIKCEATAVGEDTTLSKIIKMVSDASSTKAPIAKIADRVSGIFVPVVVCIAIVTAAAWLIAGKGAELSLSRAISVLVISCPCALGLATPVAIMVGSGVGAKKGILFKTAESLELTGKINIVALDKTGTVTKGEPEVTDIYCCEGVSEEELLTFACSIEAKSEHPLAKAIMKKAGQEGIQAKDVTDFENIPGKGLKATCTDGTVYGGNADYVENVCTVDEKIKSKATELSLQGKTPLYFAVNNTLSGFIAVSDVIKDDSKTAVEKLRKMGMRVVMLTGDNENTARAIAQKVGIDEVVASVMPDEKQSVITSLQKQGKVAMVGDGINDAPALTKADVGIAIAAGTDIAVDAADVVLVNSNPEDIVTAIKLSKATLRNIRENLFWAFFYNALGIPLAAGVFIPILGWELNPMFGAAAMSLSSFCVVSNALRLNLFGRK